MRALHLLALMPLAFVVLNSADPAIQRNIDALQKAQSLEATITVTVVNGGTEEDTLSLSKPNKLKWETPTKVVVGDGTTLWTYDKAAKTYTKSASSTEAIVKALSPEATVAWSAFFDDKFADSVKSAVKGNARKVRGADVVDYAVTLNDGRSMTISFNQTNGVAWAFKFMAKGASADTIGLMKEFKMGDVALADTLFAWTPPAGSTDANAAPAVDPNAPKFADVKSIFDHNCVSCHSGDRPKGRLDMTSYENIMAGRVVTAGNADRSRLMREIRSGKMPPAGPLSKADQDKIAGWIAGGAQK